MIAISNCCPSCGKELVQSSYSEPADVKQGGRFKFLHVECASVAELKHLLISKAERELDFFRDLTALAHNPDESSLKRFEERYGPYDEVEEEALVRPHLLISAVVGELKKRAMR